MLAIHAATEQHDRDAKHPATNRAGLAEKHVSADRLGGLHPIIVRAIGSVHGGL
jgi:hypothetical protein